jgi:hypothetical protein
MTSPAASTSACSLCGAAAVVWSWTGLALAGAGLAATALVFHLLTSRTAVKEQA